MVCFGYITVNALHYVDNNNNNNNNNKLLLLLLLLLLLPCIKSNLLFLRLLSD
jgi:hypothetical protein